MLKAELPSARPLEAFGVDGRLPGQLWRPDTTEATAKCLAEASRERLAVVPWGFGTHMSLGDALQRYDAALDLTALRAPIAHAPGDLTVTVSSGVTLSDLNAQLAQYGQCLPMDVEAPERTTVGGAIAAGVAGPRRLRHGTWRDRLLWMQVVTPQGNLVQSGAPVVKSVAGYDLGKLHIGALGSLGVITSVCFKLDPLPAKQVLSVVHCDPLDATFPLLAAVKAEGLAPHALTLTTGLLEAHHTFVARGVYLAVVFEGAAETVSWQAERFDALVKRQGLAIAHHTGAPFQEALQSLSTPRQSGALRLRLISLPDRVPELLTGLASLSCPPGALWGEVGNGVVRVGWATAPEAPAEFFAELASLMTRLRGTWMVEACPTNWKGGLVDVWGPERPDRPIMRALKLAWDPQGILAPGRAAGG
ncbi:MAG: FAD-binding oxidoreductase [Candidatus Sericytochromatia bacterium]|nr:FAD-binding oxidoreductase [Candidatus Sericytochromatia bacterium]